MTKFEAETVKKLDKTAEIFAPRPQDDQSTGWWVSVRSCLTGRFPEAIKAAKL